MPRNCGQIMFMGVKTLIFKKKIHIIQGSVHADCLKEWERVRKSRRCEICKDVYLKERYTLSVFLAQTDNYEIFIYQQQHTNGATKFFPISVRWNCVRKVVKHISHWADCICQYSVGRSMIDYAIAFQRTSFIVFQFFFFFCR